MSNPFEEFQNQLASIRNELSEIKSAIATKQEPNNNRPFLSLSETCIFTGLSKSTLYRLTSQKQIPHIKKGKLLFNRNELIAWINSPTQPKSK